VKIAKALDIQNVDVGQASKYISDNIACPKWASIFK
jgi:hypothetical protein